MHRSKTAEGAGAQPTGTVHAIELEDVVKVYPKGVRALDGLSLSVPPGAICAFLGRNGAGKSTTVRILSTLSRLTSGRAAVCGIDVDARPAEARRLIGAAMQNSAVDELMTGREHLELVAGLVGYRGRERRRRADELLDLLGLAAAGERAVAGYSGGMRRRLDLALAVIRWPRVLFLDEPSSGLDIQSRLALWQVVRDLRDRGTTVFLTTHDLGEANELADLVAVIDRGRIQATGSPGELKEELGHGTVTLHLAEEIGPQAAEAAFGGAAAAEGRTVKVAFSGGGEELRALLTAAHGHGITVDRVEVAEPALEDVYVRLTGSQLELDHDDQGAVAARAVQQMGVSR